MGIHGKSSVGSSGSGAQGGPAHSGSQKRLNILHQHNPGLAGSEFDLDLCTVVLVGDTKVGKSALLNRLVHNNFSQSYSRTSLGDRQEYQHSVRGKRIRFQVIDTNGGHLVSGGGSVNSKSASSLSLVSNHSLTTGPFTLAAAHDHFRLTGSSKESKKAARVYGAANAFLLCFKVSDPSSLFSALNAWGPELRYAAPGTPIVLVGCQIDMRNDVDICNQLSKKGQAPVSSEQGLTLSQQSGCVAYVETSAKCQGQGQVAAAFEAAALASGVLTHTPLTISPVAAHAPLLSSLSSGLPPQFIAPPPPTFRPPPVPPKPRLSSHQQVTQPTPPPLGMAVSPPVVPPKPRRAISTMALNHSTSSYSTFSSTDTSTCSSTHAGEVGNYGHHTGTSGRRTGRLREREGGSSADLLLPPMQSMSSHAPPTHHQSQHFGHYGATSYSGIFSPLCTGNVIHSVSDLVTSTPAANGRSRVGCVSAGPLSASRTTILDSPVVPKNVKSSRDKSMLSLLSIRTPKTSRKNQSHSTSNTADKTVTIKCQRLNAESKQYEEVDVEVPAPIYETLRFYNDGSNDGTIGNGAAHGDPAAAANNKSLIVSSPAASKKSIASKIKSLFGM